MKELPRKYDHKEAEKRWQAAWEEHKIYAWDEAEIRENSYVIDTPPPTVSGVLHMGHIFSYTQADFIARYQRMSGKDVFYPMGFDDNGLPTERLVEKVKKISPHKMSREDFIRVCEGVSKEARREFRHLFESVALSVDWAQEYHTISEESRRISQLSFLDLYHKRDKDGKPNPQVYRKLQPMLWDPVDQTAIAQAEIVDNEVDSHWNDIYFGIEGSDETITIGTTRPELIPACVAVLYHPEDGRYTALQGKTAITPLFGVKVPLIADDMVDREKGTGLVMCCTFGDQTDIKWWEKHDLPMRVILNKYGKISEDILAIVDNNYTQALLDAKARPSTGNPGASAREKILAWLEEEKLLVGQEPIKHMEPWAERSGAPLEILPTHQWFVKVMDKKEALKAKAAECNWHPQWMKIRMDQWIDGLSWDWCISRQRYFGVPFPVWYLANIDNLEEVETIAASPRELPVNPLTDYPEKFKNERYRVTEGHYFDQTSTPNATNRRQISCWHILDEETNGSYKLFPEPDVMDTWATSSVSPQLSSRGINRKASLRGGLAESDEAIQSSGSPRSARDDDNPYVLDASRHEKLFPADLRPQAHEIIRTWAFYTIVKAYLHEETIPWKNLMISGWCLASDKSKMSKSKGNVITPVELIEEKGADAVRFWASTSKLGTDTAFSEDVLKIGNKLVNKLWNASKFAAIQLQHVKGDPGKAADDAAITEVLDKWILTRLYRAVEKTGKEFAQYEYSNARAAVEDFFWNDFCDNYLEMVKARAYDEEGKNPAGQQSAAHTIYYCLEAVLRLFAPIVPHITEELYSHIFAEKHAEAGSIHARGNWPVAEDYPLDEAAEATGIAAREILDVVRKMKADKNVSLKWPLTKIILSGGEGGTQEQVEQCFDDLANVTNARAIVWQDNAAEQAEETESGSYSISAEFAKESDAA